MKKFLSLLKAVFSQDMELFRYKIKNKSSLFKRIFLPLLIFFLIEVSVGFYANILAEPLHKMNLTYVLLSMGMILLVFLTFIEAIYKSQSIIFDSKDNDLLFSLPINKKNILYVRIIKMLAFETLYVFMMLIPIIFVYALYEKPSFNFYIMTFIMALLISIIPTVIGSLLGFIIKKISSKFKSKRKVSFIFTFILLMGVMYLSYNLNENVTKLVMHATSIHDIILKIYYPIGLYSRLISNFNILDLLKLLIVNILPILVFIPIINKFYFKVAVSSNEVSIKSSNKKYKIRKGSKLKALIKKELNRYFSSNVYIFNTMLMPVLLLIITIAICINIDATLSFLLKSSNPGNMEKIIGYIPYIFMALISSTGFFTSITSSSISIEGKSFNLTKSLPISNRLIVLSKIIASDIIVLPFILVSIIMLTIFYRLSLLNIVMMILIGIITPTITAVFGIIVNLIYPKMDATSDSIVIKQSMSSIIATLIGFVFGTLVVVLVAILSFIMYIDYVIILAIIVLFIILILLWILLDKKVVKRIQRIN